MCITFVNNVHNDSLSFPEKQQKKESMLKTFDNYS